MVAEPPCQAARRRVLTVRHSFLVVVALAIGCAAQPWPNPPAVEQTKYASGPSRMATRHNRGSSSDVLSIVGVWPLQEGETAFGTGATLPIVLPLSGRPDRPECFAAKGATVTDRAGSRRCDSPFGRSSGAGDALAFDQDIWIDSLQLYVADAGDDRRWVTARDVNHPSVRNAVRNRDVSARRALESLGALRRVRVAETRAGAGRSWRNDDVSVARPVGVPVERPGASADGVWRAWRRRVLRDVQGSDESEPRRSGATGFLRRPSSTAVSGRSSTSTSPSTRRVRIRGYTLCPLPPPENQLEVASRGRTKRLPSAEGYSPS